MPAHPEKVNFEAKERKCVSYDCSTHPHTSLASFTNEATTAYSFILLVHPFPVEQPLKCPAVLNTHSHTLDAFPCKSPLWKLLAAGCGWRFFWGKTYLAVQHTSLQCLQGCKISKLADPARPDSFPFSPWHWSRAWLCPETTIALWPALPGTLLAWAPSPAAPCVNSLCRSLPCDSSDAISGADCKCMTLWISSSLDPDILLTSHWVFFFFLSYSHFPSGFSKWLLKPGWGGVRWCCQPNTCSSHSLTFIPVGFFIGKTEH